MFEKICIILLVNLLFFSKAITYGWVSDDIPVANRPKPKEWWKLRLFQLEGCVRTKPQEDHALTMLLHALVCVFIYTAFGATDISFAAALLFCFNPINTQASVWIAGRGYALSALGLTAAMTFPVIGPLILLGATYSNAGFFVPLVFIASKHAWMVWFLPLVWGFHYFRFKKNVVEKIKMEMYDEDKRIHPIKLVLMVKTIGFYFVHCLIPLKNTFYHSYMQSMAGAGKTKAYSFKDRFLWIGIGFFLFVSYRFITQPWDQINFGLLWFIFSILPFSNLCRMSQEIAERYTYVPNIGLMIALASYLQPHPVLFAAWLAMFATKTWFWMDAFKDDYMLVETSCVNSPDAWFAWHVRAMKRWDQQSYQESVLLWAMARLISPKEFKILFNIATALHLSNHKKEALDFIKQAASNIPGGQEKMANELLEKWHKGEVSILL